MVKMRGRYTTARGFSRSVSAFAATSSIAASPVSCSVSRENSLISLRNTRSCRWSLHVFRNLGRAEWIQPCLRPASLSISWRKRLLAGATIGAIKCCFLTVFASHRYSFSTYSRAVLYSPGMIRAPASCYTCNPTENRRATTTRRSARRARSLPLPMLAADPSSRATSSASP